MPAVGCGHAFGCLHGPGLGTWYKGVPESLNGLSAELADLGHLNERGGPLSAASVALGLGHSF